MNRTRKSLEMNKTISRAHPVDRVVPTRSRTDKPHAFERAGTARRYLTGQVHVA